MNEEEHSQPEKTYALRPNKTALKKEHSKVQNLAKELVRKTPQALSKLPLSENILLQIELAGQIKGGALKRQIKHIANLLLTLDEDPFNFLLNEENQLLQASVQQSKKAEESYLKLIEQGDDYLQILLDNHPQLERQTLRNLMLQARREKPLEKSTKHQRKLSAYLKQKL